MQSDEKGTGLNTSFEGSLKELEQIIQELEKGERPLDLQLKAFERGVALSRACLAQLEAVEKKVEILVQGEGKLQTVPFDCPTSPA